MARAVGPASSLNDLYVWLMSRSWNMHKDSEPAAVELAAEVEALLLERSDGRLGDADVGRRIINLLNNVVVSHAIEATSQDLRVFAWLTRVRFHFTKAVALLQPERNPGQAFAVPQHIKPEQSKVLYA